MHVKPKCTHGAVYRGSPPVHDVYMEKKPTKKGMVQTRLRPLYQRTFIREWRERRKLTQEQLAEMVGEYLEERGIKVGGYSYASIGRMENGKMPYHQAVMEGISDALKVPVTTLISRPPPPPGEPEPPEPETLLRLWSEFSKMRGQT